MAISVFTLDHRLSPPMLRTALWTLRARIRAPRVVWRDGLAEPLALPSPPPAPLAATPAVVGILGRTRATCLVRSLVLQHWFADHGEDFDVVIGVTAPADGFRAHAWLDRPGMQDGAGFIELHRLPAPTLGLGGKRR